jgi:cytochrome c peroxidase
LCAASVAVLALISSIFAASAAPGLNEDSGVGPLPALAPGQAPPLPKPGPLAEPRSSNQVGFPTVYPMMSLSSFELHG